MYILLTILWASNHFLPISTLNLIDLPPVKHNSEIKIEDGQTMPITTSTSTAKRNEVRRYLRQTDDAMKKIEEEHDSNLKKKISVLVQQTIHDTTKKIEAIQKIKTENRDKAAYRAGFLINLIKKSKDVVNELFSVGVKHKEDWKALEQMKTYELLVHANVDTDNWVKQLVDIHTSFKKTS